MMARWLLASIALASLLGVVTPAVPAIAGGSDSVAHCYDQHEKWPSHWAYYHRPSHWEAKWRNNIDDAAENVEVETPMTLYVVASSSGPRLIRWTRFRHSDWNFVGGTSKEPFCNLEEASIRMNRTHFEEIDHTGNQMQCSFIHELGHAIGLRDVIPESWTQYGPTVMRQGDLWRCHDRSTYELTARDVNDLIHVY